MLICLIAGAGLLFGHASQFAADDEVGSNAAMVLIPAGTYMPLFKDSLGMDAVEVGAFYLDVYPVSNKQFLAFVRANPRWRRSRIAAIFADDSYLQHWAGDLDLGGARPNAPVTNVSWFAARAYAAWRGVRLPLTAEWEYAGAMAPRDHPDADHDEITRRILDWYSRPTPRVLPDVGRGFENVYGICDMHGLIWEWVDDFSSSLVNGDSRGDSDLERNLFCGAAATRAADVNDYAAFMRTGFRSSLEAGFCIKNLGFRCARDAN